MGINHLSRRSFLSACAAFPLLAEDQSSVQVLNVQQQSLSANRKIYQVRFKYDFHQADPVKIKGFGVVPPSGELKYSSYDPALEFQSTDNKTLFRMNLTPSTTTMGAEGNEPPSPESFPPATKPGFWSGNAAQFSLRMVKVLGAYFPLGIIALAPAAGNDRMETTWHTSAAEHDQNLFVHIAVLLNRPDSAGSSGFQFGLQYVAQESRARTPRRDLSTPAAVDEVTSFLNNLIAELQKAS